VEDRQVLAEKLGRLTDTLRHVPQAAVRPVVAQGEHRVQRSELSLAAQPDRTVLARLQHLERRTQLRKQWSLDDPWEVPAEGMDEPDPVAEVRRLQRAHSSVEVEGGVVAARRVLPGLPEILADERETHHPEKLIDRGVERCAPGRGRERRVDGPAVDVRNGVRERLQHARAESPWIHRVSKLGRRRRRHHRHTIAGLYRRPPGRARPRGPSL